MAATTSAADAASGGAASPEGGVFGVPPKYKAAASNYLRTFTYATAGDKVVVTASCLAAFGSGLTMPAMYILFGRLTGDFTGFFKQGAGESEGEFILAVDDAVLKIIYVFVVKLLLTYLSHLGLRITSLRISSTIRVVYLRALVSLPISTLDMLPTGQTAAIITTVASNLQQGISEKLSTLFASAGMVLGSLAVAVAYDALLTLATGLGLLLVGAVYYGITPRIAALLAAVLARDMAAAAVAAEALSPTAARMLAACGAGDKIVARYSRCVEEGHREGARMAPLVGLQNGLINFAVYATFALAFWFAFQLYFLMEISSPEPLIVVLLSTILMATSLGQLSPPIAAALQAAEAVAIFHTIIDFPKPVHGTRTDVALRGSDILLDNVHFAYPARPEVKILDGLHLRFPAGKITAIVGPSGCGKSTIVGIVERWYEFNGDPLTNPLVLWFRNGSVSVSGTPLKDIDPKWWRSQIGLVQQENVLFDTSIYKNVEYGLVGTQWEHAGDKVKGRMIKAACRDAYADDFISRLPEGYQTQVGQGGVKLSGGQRQRLAIARAIVKQPALLLLDEATSAIDVRSERIVQAALDRASAGRTTIVVAHRLATIRAAHHIVVLRAGGHVVQQGTHAALMADAAGAYRRLVEAQALLDGGGGGGVRRVVVEGEGEAEAEELLLLNSPGGGGSTWTDETLGTTEPLPACAESYGEKDGAREKKGRNVEDDDDADLLRDGRVAVVGGSSSSPRPAVWTILSEQAPHHWPLFAVMLLGALGAGAATPVQAYLFSVLLSLFSFWDAQLHRVVDFWVLLTLALAVGVGLGHAALGWSTAKLGFAVSRAYRIEYFANTVRQPAAFFDSESADSADTDVNGGGTGMGALASRLAADPAQLQQFAGLSAAALATSALNLVGCVAVALAFGWKLTLVALGATLPVVTAAMVMRMRYERALDAASGAVFARSARFACERIAAMRTAVSLTLEAQVCATYEALLRDHVRAGLRASSVSVLLFALSDSVPLLCMAFVLWYGGQLLGAHEYSPFQYMVVYIAVLQGGISAGQWLSLGPNMAQATAAAERILAMRDGGDDDDDNDEDHNNTDRQQTAAVVPETSSGEKTGVALQFRNVGFHYPTRSVPVLAGLDLTIEKGQFAAIVGPSGCGKSTLIALLERFYTPQHGQILLNGVDIARLNLVAYRTQLSLVAQEPSLFSGTIRDNITLGIADDDGGDDDARVHQAARDAGIHEFIVSLPEGYNTPIGVAGLALSGGQKQRISLARALIRRPSLLLLDEATSSLDSETEARVQAVLDATKGVRTMVVVAHRLATVQNADVIFVLGEDGRLVEKGDHLGLVARRGSYYKMCQLQSMDSG